MIFAIICRIRKKFAYLHQKKVLLGSEGPGSTKAVYVAQAGLFYFFLAFRNSGVVNTAAGSVTQSSKTYR